MQETSDDHDQIKKIVFGVSQNTFHDSRALNARKCFMQTPCGKVYLE